MKVVHSWLKDYIGEAIPTPAELEALLTFHAFEIDGVEMVAGESVLDVDVLPNRSSDCLCHRGIAREIASITGVPLVYDPLRVPPTLAATDEIAVTIEDETACPRFTAALITGVEVKESPEWLKQRLQAIGQRPINTIVDATNYVMYAIGQPLHAYDADLFPRVDGRWHFQVRFARPGETVSLIPEGGKAEDRIVTCEGTELLIVDASSDTPIGLAGVKGGRYAGVHADTKRVIIEAAHFHPTITRKTARRLGIVIDASKRFENEPSRELPLYAQQEIISLITQIAGGTCAGVIDQYLQHRESPVVRVTLRKINARLGLALTTIDVSDILTRLGATVTTIEDGVYEVTGPIERTDLLIEEDFIDEIARLHGLANIQSVPPPALPVPSINLRHYYTERLRTCLVERGFSEIITSSFAALDEIQLQNALASDKSYVRSTIQKNLQSALDQNSAYVDLLGLRQVQLFEIGTVFTKTTTGIAEEVRIALGVRSKGGGYTTKDDTPLQVAQSAVETALGTTLSWEVSRGVAEASLSAVLPTLPMPNAYEPFEPPPVTTYQPVSPYPSITRDVALWVPQDTPAAEVLSLIKKVAGPMCVRCDLFDEFAKDTQTSYAFRLVFQSPDRTLVHDEVDIFMADVYTALADAGWTVR